MTVYTILFLVVVPGSGAMVQIFFTTKTMLCFSILLRKEFDGFLLRWSRKEVLIKVFSPAGQ